MRLLYGILPWFVTVSVSAAEPKLSRHSFEQPLMGTTFRIVVYAESVEVAKAAAQAGFARGAELNAIFSDYSKTSETSRLCAQFSKGNAEPVTVSAEMATVLRAALDLSAQSEGAFDITVGPVVELWRHARRTQELPSKAELTDALAKVGWRKILLNDKTRQVTLTTAGMKLDFGGIAKGYAADEILAVLAQRGLRQALVAAGGDVAVGDAPPDAPAWRVQIAPLTKSSAKPILYLTNAAVSTSGDAEQFVEIGGVRYSHIVDPRTGLGQVGRRSVTVVARRGIQADSLTKAVALMPPEKAMKLLAQIPGAEARIVVLEGDQQTERTTPGFALLTKNPER